MQRKTQKENSFTNFSKEVIKFGKLNKQLEDLSHFLTEKSNKSSCTNLNRKYIMRINRPVSSTQSSYWFKRVTPVLCALQSKVSSKTGNATKKWKEH